MLLAQAMVASGMAQVIVAGGVESYSRRPLRLATDPDGGPAVPYDRPGFTPWAERDPDMHVAAGALATALGIGRAEQDDWAIQSHAKALASSHPEVVELLGQGCDGFARLLTARTTMRAKALAGSVTVANAAIAADAAAFVVVVGAARARAIGGALRIVAGATLGGHPEEPGLAPVAAIRQALSQAGLQNGAIGVAEIMEAYAVQAIACVRGAGLDPQRVNLGGGALARGHPIGASGAILAVRLYHQMQHGFGLAAIAAAGGIGTALVVGRM